MTLLLLPEAGEAACEPVPADKVIAGAPVIRTWVHYDDEPSGLSAGEWEATQGKWRIAYTEWEYVTVLSGHCVITGDDGSRIEASAGGRFIIEPGFTGTWEVTQTMRKQWVIKI